MKKAVQQIMLGTVCKDQNEALRTLKSIKQAGYDSIELNGFMIKPTSFLVRLLTKLAGMPTGRGGSWNWKELVDEAGLSVASIHEDLGSIENDIDRIIKEAKNFETDKVVVTGMYRFDYRDLEQVDQLCKRLNEAGKKLLEQDIHLLYHNHNVEWVKCGKTTAYQYLIDHTDPEYLNFEFDSYWPAEAGVDVVSAMASLGTRMKLYHINDRGSKLSKVPLTPILKSDSMELGSGNMPLEKLLQMAESFGVDTVILESHKNWIDHDPIKSLTISGDYLNKHIG